MQPPGQLHELEHPQDCRLVGDEVDAPAEQALPVVDPQQAPDTGRVDERDAAQVDDQAVDAAVEQAEQRVTQRRSGGRVDLARDADDGVRSGLRAGRAD